MTYCLRYPYGQTMTYEKELRLRTYHRRAEWYGAVCRPRQLAELWGIILSRIIIPYHRVVGAGGSLTGYAGGLDRKIELLKLEKAL